MYTRCPSCRAEISFEPPANMENLPDGYKHRIKCPSCGVTIGVKISKQNPVPYQAPMQPAFEGVNEPIETVATAKQNPKHSGIGRNITMMILSLLFIALTVVGNFITDINGLIGNEKSVFYNLFGVSLLDGVQYWDKLILKTDDFLGLFSNGDVLNGIIKVLPMVVLTLAGINFIVAFISACGKKYGRAYNLISSLLIGACAIASLLIRARELNANNLIEGLQAMFSQEFLLGGASLIVFAALGLVQIILGFCFLKSLKRKQI